MIKKAFLFIFIVISIVSCKKEQYHLKWKLPDSEVLIYSIQMETIDSLSSVTGDNMRVLVDLVAKMYGDTVNVPVTSNDLYHGLVRQLNKMSYFSILRKGSNKDIKIDFITRQVKEYEQIKYLDIYNKFIRKAFFKGNLAANGKLTSEKGGDVFDPKINILFELPEKPVAVGDTWSLNIRPPEHAISKSQIDSIKNLITFSDLVIDGGDTIAILDYQLQSPDKSGNAISFTGKVKFSISQGKWLEYTGILSQKTSGLLPMNHVQTIKLYEISVQKYKAIIKQAQKVDIFGEENKDEPLDTNSDPIGENEKLSKNTDCPEVFRVQLQASQQAIDNPKMEFKNIPYQIDEIIINPSEKFKYKYTVGNECDKQKASELLKQIVKLGYSKAYIIRTKGNL
jgi:hypothetical protein